MHPIILDQIGIAGVTRIVSSALLRLGVSLRTTDPVRRATKRLTSDSRMMRRPLRLTIKRWVSDDDVIHAIHNTQLGGVRATTTDAIVDAFVRHSAIPGLTRDAAVRFIEKFWILLEQEAAKEDSGSRRQENITRYEARRTRAETRRIGTLIENAIPSLRSVVTQEDGDQRWDQRIDDANRFLTDRKIRSALAVYEQILSDAKAQGFPPRIRYRLHANIGSCHFALDHLQRALTHFDIARDSAPDEALPLWQMGQIHLQQGEPAAALKYAEEAIARDPENVQAWIVALHARDSTDCADVPSHVRDTAEFSLTCAHKALGRGESKKMIGLARRALEKSDRSPEQLVAIAEILVLGSSGPLVAPLPETIRRDVVRLTSEAIDSLPPGELPHFEARALTVKGHALIDFDLTAARQSFEQAFELAPRAVGPRLGLADAFLRAEEYFEALFVLRDLPAESADIRVHVLRARAMACQDPGSAEIETAIRRAMDLVGDDLRGAGFLLDLADTATRAELPDLTDTILAALEFDSIPAVVSLMQARVAMLRGDTQAAHDLYDRAVDAAPTGNRTAIQTEFAGFLASQGHHDLAVDHLRATDPDQRSDDVRGFYARELMQAGEWTELEDFIGRIGGSEDLPDWALDTASMLALRRDDLASARTFLVKLLSRGRDSGSVSIRLAYALIRMGELDEAIAALDLWCSESFDASMSADAAKLYYHAQEYDAAVRIAYRGWRVDPTDAELEQLLVSLVFRSPTGLPSTTDPHEVTTDSWVRLEEVSGDAEVSYSLTSEVPIPGRVDEIASDSPEAALLLGKRVNDTVTLPPIGIDPVVYRVREIRSNIVGLAQSILRRVGTRLHSGHQAVQSIRIGSPDSVTFLAPVIAKLYKDEASREYARRLYHERRLPLAIFSKLANISMRQAYDYLTSAQDESLHVELGTAPSVATALQVASSARTVVLSKTAWFTLQSLGLLELLPKVYEQTCVPPSLLDSLRKARTRIAIEVERGEAYRLAAGPRGVHLEEIPISIIESEMKAIDDLVSFINAHSTPIQRRHEALRDEYERLRAALGDAEMDVLFAATTTRPLFADDQGLRALATDERDVPSFSTASFLQVAEERGACTTQARLEATVGLIGAGHTFVPISAELLMAALRLDGMAIGPRSTSVLDRLTKHTSPERSVTVAAAFLRAVFNTPLARPAFDGIVWRLLDAFFAIPDDGTAVELFDAVADGTLRLLPFAQDRYRQRRDAFKAMKEMSP